MPKFATAQIGEEFIPEKLQMGQSASSIHTGNSDMTGGPSHSGAGDEGGQTHNGAGDAGCLDFAAVQAALLKTSAAVKDLDTFFSAKN